jgi:hypothetical protein
MKHAQSKHDCPHFPLFTYGTRNRVTLNLTWVSVLCSVVEALIDFRNSHGLLISDSRFCCVYWILHRHLLIAVQLINKSPAQLEVHDSVHKYTILSNFNPGDSIIAYPLMIHFDIVTCMSLIRRVLVRIIGFISSWLHTHSLTQRQYSAMSRLHSLQSTRILSFH